jgi:hypothetical protein
VDWHTLSYENYRQFFRDTVQMVGPIMGSDNPDLRHSATTAASL